MRYFTVHEPERMAETRDVRAESLVFVEDGFRWPAFLLGPFYFVARGAWLSLAIYVAAALLVVTLTGLVTSDPTALSLTFLALNVLAAFEAGELERLSLRMNGWRDIGVSNGRNIAEAERRFFEGWIEREPLITPAAWLPQTPAPAASLLSAEGLEHRLRAYAARLRANLPEKT